MINNELCLQKFELVYIAEVRTRGNKISKYSKILLLRLFEQKVGFESDLIDR